MDGKAFMSAVTSSQNLLFHWLMIYRHDTRSTISVVFEQVLSKKSVWMLEMSRKNLRVVRSATRRLKKRVDVGNVPQESTGGAKCHTQVSGLPTNHS